MIILYLFFGFTLLSLILKFKNVFKFSSSLDYWEIRYENITMRKCIKCCHL